MKKQTILYKKEQNQLPICFFKFCRLGLCRFGVCIIENFLVDFALFVLYSVVFLVVDYLRFALDQRGVGADMIGNQKVFLFFLFQRAESVLLCYNRRDEITFALPR